MKIGEKTFMNLQEAVGWLLENNALPFQSTANYVGNTEIAMSTLINPSPAKVRVGSLIFFADSKVSTVVGVTSNSFIVSNQYNDLVDDVVYVSNVALNASGHLIVTLSNGNTIDAGLVKQVTGFSINGSQHLIITYNDGSTTDLGAIFSGNITISGNLTVTGTIDGDTLLEKIKDAQGHNRFVEGNIDLHTDLSSLTKKYGKWSLSGTHLMIVFAFANESGSSVTISAYTALTVGFALPSWVANKIYPLASNVVSQASGHIIDPNSAGVPKALKANYLPKTGDYVQISTAESITLEAGEAYRIQFDLLIDNS